MTTHVTVANNAEVKAAIPARRRSPAASAMRRCGHRGHDRRQVSPTTTPAADYPLLRWRWAATIKTDRRSIKADDFFTGMFSTALEQGELITAVEFPVPVKAAYEKFRNSGSALRDRRRVRGADRPVACGSRSLARARAACSAHAEMEQALAGNFSAAAIKEVKTSPDDLNGDIHAKAWNIARICVRHHHRACRGQSGMSQAPDLRELVANPGASSLALA